MVAIGTLVFLGAMIALQLAIGSALIGWAGDSMVVERTERPGPYGASIVLQMAIWIAFGAMWFAAK
jgi:hypothetical protein